LFSVADFDTADFTADGLGEFVDELDKTGVFVGGGDVFDVFLQLMNKVVTDLVFIRGGEDDGGFDDLSAYVVRDTGDGTFHDGRMGHEGTLDFERADAVTGTFDNVVGTANIPEITVLIPPSDVSGMVDIVIPCRTGQIGVAIVFLEDTEAFTVGTDDDFTLLAVFGTGTVGADEVNVVLRIGLPHRAGFRFHPWESSNGEGGLGLSETFHELDTCETEESLVNGRVEGFAGDGTVAKGGKVVTGKVFADEITEDGGGRTEGGDTVLLYLLEDIGGVELLVVVDKDGSAGDPLPIELPPDGFSPTGIGNGEVEAVGAKIVPETSGGDMGKGIGVVVGDHLGITGGAGSEVHDGGIGVLVGMRGTMERWGGGDTFVEVMKTRGNGWTNGDEGLQGWRNGGGGTDLGEDIVVTGADDHLDIGSIVTVDDVFGGEKVCSGDDDGAEFMQGNDGIPELLPAFEDDHDFVAMPDTEGLEKGSCTVAEVFDLGKREIAVFAGIVSPTEGTLGRVGFGPCINNIISEIELLRDIYFEVLTKVFLRSIAGLCNKAF
jgi:hypothetical protein